MGACLVIRNRRTALASVPSTFLQMKLRQPKKKERKSLSQARFGPSPFSVTNSKCDLKSFRISKMLSKNARARFYKTLLLVLRNISRVELCSSGEVCF